MKAKQVQKKSRFICMILIVITGFLLEGCGVYRSSFDCKPSKGVGCESVSKVNELINDEKLDDFIKEGNQSKASRVKNKCSPCPKSMEKRAEEIEKQKNEVTSYIKIKIHFNEYKDASGVLHKPSEVEVSNE